MENLFKITIPKPCHEDWDTMTPNDSGRFCRSCAKSVVDFTGMKATAISDYLISHKSEGVCGRFREVQLDALVIRIPDSVLFSQTQFHKVFLLALLLSMGTTLFSCSDKDGNKQKIDKVEVVKDEDHQGSLLGEPAFVESDTLSNSASRTNNNKDCTNPSSSKGNDKSTMKLGLVSELTTTTSMGDVAIEKIPSDSTAKIK